MSRCPTSDSWALFVHQAVLLPFLLHKMTPSQDIMLHTVQCFSLRPYSPGSLNPKCQQSFTFKAILFGESSVSCQVCKLDLLLKYLMLYNFIYLLQWHYRSVYGNILGCCTLPLQTSQCLYHCLMERKCFAKLLLKFALLKHQRTRLIYCLPGHSFCIS